METPKQIDFVSITCGDPYILVTVFYSVMIYLIKQVFRLRVRNNFLFSIQFHTNTDCIKQAIEITLSHISNALHANEANE